jgi:type IV pilus assembly protein PilY1
MTRGKGTSIKKWENTACNSGSGTIATGNWLRFNYADASNKLTCNPKIGIAKQVIKDLLDDVQGVRVGVMTFNNMFTAPDGYGENEGGRILEQITSLTDTTRTHLKNDIDTITAGGWTPLAETLYEAGLYFGGANSYFNSGTYTSPIQIIDGKPLYCQKNYVILMTDGMSTKDQNSILDTAIRDQNSDGKEPPPRCTNPDRDSCDEGSDYLDDVAKYLYDTDLRTDMQGKQNVVTYTIGFDLDSSVNEETAEAAKDLLQRAATLGHGKFYTTEGSAGLADAFSSILNEVLAKTSSFVAPIVPVSKMERTTAGDRIYLAFFRPNQSGMWSGNIKKYGVALSKDPSKGIDVGDILDSSLSSKALDSKGEFYPSSKSFWTTSSSDGGEVQVGGVGEVLKNRNEPYPAGTPVQDPVNDPLTFRNIYTLLPGDASDEDNTGSDSNTSFDLTNSWNAFTTTNSRLTASKLGVSTDTDKNNLVNFVRGIDVYDDNVNGDTTDKRDWMLGSFLHSRPYVIHYADRTVIYAGANDGMLHAFDDATGKELWGFIPPALLGKLKCLHTGCADVEDPVTFVDGSPRAYVTYASDGITVTEAILVFGLRRGGNYYYALDITNPTTPQYKWRIYKGKDGYFNELGQTWSTPVIGKVAYGTGEKWVAIFGGGYDKDQDVVPNPPADDIGRGIYMADVRTGQYVWGKSYHGGFTDMTCSVPSDVAKVDLDGDERIDRLYVGDTGGRMFRFDIGDLNKNGISDPDEWTAKKIFSVNPGNSEKRKIFYPPDVTLEKDSTGEYEMLFFGTGDREEPKGEKSDKDILVAFKDKNVFKTARESDLIFNVTDFYTLSATQQTAKINQIKTGYGWYMLLDSLGSKKGEKCLASPVVYAKTAYYTTFYPTQGSGDDLCFVGEGTATLYALNYMTGEAVLNLDGSLDGAIGVTDRSVEIGTAIPSGVVITVIGGKVTAYAGVGGGVERVQLTSTKSLFPLTWKLVF